MGVNVNTIISATFVLGSALGAVAGVMVATNYDQAHYYMGFMIGLKAFTAAVLGGIGNLGGAVAGGILLGIIESPGCWLYRSAYRWFPRLQLSGHLCLHGTDSGVDFPSVRPVGRKDGRPCLIKGEQT
ncbi:branched-chain amino acid ABC transporter permease [Paludibacterium denitrificans]|uniref:branched-chain amino acid ABC transporter permease n=1 Tax=Paludibacterium denitrificans TaxID=2675226 RepID=UPI002477E6F5